MSESFPESLLPFRALIEPTRLPFVRFHAALKATQLWESKLGGIPYFPLDHEPLEFFQGDYSRLKHHPINCTPWPKHSKKGTEIFLFAQINFEEIPPLDRFPRTGILQIFACPFNLAVGPLCGPGHEVRVLYHPEIIRDPTRLWTDFGRLHAFEDDGCYIAGQHEYGLSFEKCDDLVSPADFRFDAAFEGHSHDGQPVSTLLSNLPLCADYTELRRTFRVTNNRIGGYHDSLNFQDPRRGREDWHESMLLLQFDGDDRGHTYSWADGGSCQFFIKNADLQACDFSQLLFHWDST